MKGRARRRACMERRSGRGLVVTTAGATLALALASPAGGGDRATITPARAGDECPAPVITGLRLRSGGDRGRRAKLRVGARATRGRVNALYVQWGDRAEAVVDLVQRRSVFVEVARQYARSGRYRISVVAEQISPGCPFTTSRPGTTVVRVPLSTLITLPRRLHLDSAR